MMMLFRHSRGLKQQRSIFLLADFMTLIAVVLVDIHFSADSYFCRLRLVWRCRFFC